MDQQHHAVEPFGFPANLMTAAASALDALDNHSPLHPAHLHPDVHSLLPVPHQAHQPVYQPQAVVTTHSPPNSAKKIKGTVPRS
jgi:hypothetical protein